MGGLAGRLLMMFAEMVQKWAVVPESAMASLTGEEMAGGPTKELDSWFGVFNTLLSAAGLEGSPRRQRRVDDCRLRGGNPGIILSLPPCMLKAVALSMCPVALRLQVCDVCN